MRSTWHRAGTEHPPSEQWAVVRTHVAVTVMVLVMDVAVAVVIIAVTVADMNVQ